MCTYKCKCKAICICKYALLIHFAYRKKIQLGATQAYICQFARYVYIHTHTDIILEPLLSKKRKGGGRGDINMRETTYR